MKRIQKNLFLISNFEKLNKQQRREFLRYINADQLKFLSELCINLLNQNIRINNDSKKKLKTHRFKIRKLADRRVPLKKKKEIIQVGGFVGVLLSALASSAVSFALEKLLQNAQTKS